MLFTKSGEDLLAQLTKVIEANRQDLLKAQEFFEREKEKAALQRIQELELEVERFERILRHTSAEHSYQLTEQDLIDLRW